MKKLYSVLIIVLPIFVGTLAIDDLILHFTGNASAMSPLISGGLAVIGMGTGIVNILKLLK